MKTLKFFTKCKISLIYWPVWFMRKSYSILGCTHTWLGFSVSWQSTVVPVPKSPASLQPHCSGHNRAWAWLPVVHMSSCWRTTQRTWLTSLTFFCSLCCVVPVKDGTLAFLDFSIMQGGIICMIKPHGHVAQPCLYSCMSDHAVP